MRLESAQVTPPYLFAALLAKIVYTQVTRLDGDCGTIGPMFPTEATNEVPVVNREGVNDGFTVLSCGRIVQSPALRRGLSFTKMWFKRRSMGKNIHYIVKECE